MLRNPKRKIISNKRQIRHYNVYACKDRTCEIFLATTIIRLGFRGKDLRFFYFWENVIFKFNSWTLDGREFKIV